MTFDTVAAPQTARRGTLLTLACAVLFALDLAALPARGQGVSGGAASPASAPVRPQKEPTCTHCKERLKTVEALKQTLPAGWTFQLERESVFGSDILVVEAGQGHPQTLLLVHGLGQNGFTDWLPLLPHLAQRYHVIALDLPGFGYSGAPSGKYSPSNYARLLHALLTRHAKQGVIAVGHSMGAAVVLRLASLHPELVSKLILVDAAGILHRTAFAKHNASLPLAASSLPQLLKEPVARAAELGNTLVERIFGMPDLTRVLKESDLAWELLLRNRANTNAALALMDEDFSAAVHALQQPTQIIWGEADKVAPLRTGQLLARRLPRAELQSLPGVGHTPMLEAPQRFLALLSTALDAEPKALPPPAGGALEPTDLKCSGQADAQYSGHYRDVLIEGCSAVRLVNLSAERIVIRNSIVQMQGVQVRSADVALDVSNSEVTATASDFSGEVAIRADAARIDLAGVHLLAIGNAVEAKRASRLIGSISRIQSPDFTGYWHDDVEVSNSRLVPARRRE
ncbi:MAG: alpha/beta hydrolase [Burkholderiaceae bacterium]